MKANSTLPNRTGQSNTTDEVCQHAKNKMVKTSDKCDNKRKCAFNRIVDRTDLKGTNHENFKDQLLRVRRWLIFSMTTLERE